MKNAKNPLNYPDYLRGIPPADPNSFPQYTITELEKIQNSMVNLATASAKYTSTRVDTVVQQVESDTAALASRLDTVETDINGNTASISTLQSSVDGLSLKYSVTLDSNGYITGFEQNNDGQTGQFILRADVFKVVSPGQTPKTMFQVDASGVHFTGKTAVTGLTTGTLNADMNVGTGKIIWDNGTYMKVAGVGFGTNNQFIEWFGPKMAVSSCSEANAVTYLKTDGSAYFGGSLSAGTLTNKATSSATGVPTSVFLGPYGSNGKPKVVTVSYSFMASQSIDGACPAGTPSAVIRLYQGKDATGTLVATINAGGSMTCEPGHGWAEPGYVDVTMGGSASYTDNRTMLSGYEYYAEVVSRTSPIGTNIVQRLTIISVEE